MARDAMTSPPKDTPTTAVLRITATEPEPRTVVKQVVLSGPLDHCCARPGLDKVAWVAAHLCAVRPLARIEHKLAIMGDDG